MSTDTAPAAAKATINKPTCLLFWVASRSHTLREMFGIEDTNESAWRKTEPGKERLNLKMTFTKMPRPWLVREHEGSNELTFDADIFARRLHACSSGEHHMILFILNVWNPGYARSKDWTFDFFPAMDSLDTENRDAIAAWLKEPVWP